MTTTLIDFAVLTIFAREVLEGAIIIGEYRTIILRGDSLEAGVSKEEALREITLSSLFATALALLVIAAIAIPLALLSRNFSPYQAKIIEGVSKIVAAICLLQLSLKVPKLLGIYGSCKKKGEQGFFQRLMSLCVRRKKSEMTRNASDDGGDEESRGDVPTRQNSTSQEGGNAPETETGMESKLTINSIRFNVAWNIWREVAECGVFLLPFFLSNEKLLAIPLSAVIGSMVGAILGLGIYYANRTLKNKKGLAIFSVFLLVVLSAGLFTGGCHNIETQVGTTKTVWKINGAFWSVDRLPMTVLKPFGYNDSRTVLEIVCYWGWFLLAALLHYRKYRISPKISDAEQQDPTPETEETYKEENGQVRRGSGEHSLSTYRQNTVNTEDCSIERSIASKSVKVSAKTDTQISSSTP